MMSRVAMIIGGGPGVGYSVAHKLLSEGYKVAVGSRNPDVEKVRARGYFPFRVDAADPQSVHAAFGVVAEELGAFPRVVVYNAVGVTVARSGDVLAEVPTAELEKFFRINTLSFYEAARTAVKGWTDGGAVSPCCIFTGNPLPWLAMPKLLSMGPGKAASANLVANLVEGYKEKGFRFYYAYQVANDGGVSLGISGDGIAEGYWKLVEEKQQGPWQVELRADGSVFARGRPVGTYVSA